MKIHRIAGGAVIVMALTLFACSPRKAAPPEGGKPRDFKIPEVKTFTLENGLGVSMIRYGSVPKASIRFVIRAGSINEAPDQVWIADMAADFLKEGTVARTAKEIAEASASMGGEISAGAGSDTSSLSGTVLSEFVPDFLSLLADMLKNPKFPESELGRIRANYLRRLALAKSEPSSLASDGFFHVLYGDHPYGRTFPSESRIQSYTIATIKKFYAENYGARRTHLYIAGVFDERKAEQAIREALKDWKAGNEMVTNVPAPKSARKVHVLDRPGSVQSTILLGLPVIPPAHEDFIALEVADTLLGGAFASRITSNIRENKGYTYSPTSAIIRRYKDACWYEQADVATNVTGAALKEIFFEIDRLKNEAPAEAELKGIKNLFSGTFILQNSTPNGIIGILNYLRLNELGKDYLSTYIRNVFKVTPAEIQKIVADRLRGGDMTIFIVGDYEKIKDQVAVYGEVIKEESK
ncbi:MAG: pitrilysin family protein [Candidatus Aminicenantales bacterium]